ANAKVPSHTISNPF
nr:RecName: Full=64 kDa cell wall protein [Solanum lycopersicum]